MSVTIREATLDDLPALARIGRKFYEEAELSGEYREERFVESWAKFMGLGIACVLVAEEDDQILGGFAGLIYDSIFTDDLWFDEVCWYVDPEHRGGTAAMRLFRAAQEWSRDKGVVVMRVGHRVNLMPERLGRFYQAAGFKPSEVLFSREIN